MEDRRRQGMAGGYMTRRGDKALVPALARGETIARSAKAAGISERTVYRRLMDPEFKRRVQESRTRLLEQATGKLVGAAEGAIDTLVALLDSRSDSVRLGAARAILVHLLRLKELSEFEGRLDALEEVLARTGRLSE